MDNFYKDPAITRLDKGLFAFASYNAGPGRVAVAVTYTLLKAWIEDDLDEAEER